MLYGSRSSGREHGVVLTKPEVVHKMLDLVGYTSDQDLRAVKVVEPSAGEGAFALPIVERLYGSSVKFSFDFEKALANIRFFDIDENSINVLEKRVSAFVEQVGAEAKSQMFVCGDFLTTAVGKCDLVIGNPPYVRHENIPDEYKEMYKKKYRTFTHRSDLYIPFYEKGLRLLNEGGCLSFICSNRWLKNQYGKQLRHMIESEFSIKEIIDLEKVEAFEESVIAYPAITTIINARSSVDSPYHEVDNLNALMQFESNAIPSRLLSSNSRNWFARDYSKHGADLHLTSIVDHGFKIGIGVATGKDKIFIRKDFRQFIEHELLLPILTSKGVKGNTIEWQGDYLINPYTKDGGQIDLNNYPKAQQYFLEHYDTLSDRHVARKNPGNWYRTIDRVHASLTAEPKIILPDITGNKIIHIDKGEFYPHHNLYYITGGDHSTLELLAAVLMSDFVREQLSEMGNKMNGGYPRWQSQNIKKLRIPFLDSIPPDQAAALRTAYRNQDLDSINELMVLDNFSDYERREGQLTFFEPDATSEYGEKG